MSASEDQQLAAVANFVVANKLHRALQAHDWQSFARGYNGQNYKANQYDSKLAAAFQKYSTGDLPDLSVRAAQLYLTYLGYQPGRVEGVVGPRTMSALAAFQSDRGLPSSNTIDTACAAQLYTAVRAAAAVTGERASGRDGSGRNGIRRLRLGQLGCLQSRRRR